MENFTPILSGIGGMLIGLSAAMMLFFSGRIAGISGIFRGVISPEEGEFSWRAFFVAGLLAGGAAMFLLQPEFFEIALEPNRNWYAFVVAGLLVGFGTRLGNGCTSGHGVCGMSRLSARSFVATASFMAAGAATVYVINHVIGGTI
ncbi:MAG: YeeE/YedE family protein [Persicimonas sp.]